MAVSYGSAGSIAYGSTSVASAYPSGITSGELLILVVGTKPGSATIATPSGWTLQGSSVGTTGTNGVDTGPTKVAIFTKTAAGSESGTQTASITSGNTSWGQIVRLSNSTGYWALSTVSGEDTSAGADYSAACTAPNTSWAQTGDLLVAGTCIPTDITGGWSAETFASTGLTFGAVTEIAEASSSTGNDIGGVTFYGSVSSGTMSTTTVTASATRGGTTTNVYGPTVVLRARESAAPAMGGIPVEVGVTTFTDLGNNNPSNITLPPGAVSYVLHMVFSVNNSNYITVNVPPEWTVVYAGAPVAEETGYFQYLLAYTNTSDPSTPITRNDQTSSVWRYAGSVRGFDREITGHWFAHSSGSEAGTTWDSRSGPTVSPTVASLVLHTQGYQYDASSPVDNETIPSGLSSKAYNSTSVTNSFVRHRSGYVTQPSAGTSTAQTWTSGTEVEVWAWALSVLAITGPPDGGNSPPVANAGSDQTGVAPGHTVTLDASASTDSDGTITGYSWAQTGGSPTVSLSGSGATRTFAAPPTLNGTTLTFEVTVTDNSSGTNSDSCTVTVLPAPMRIMTGDGIKPAIRKIKNS